MDRALMLVAAVVVLGAIMSILDTTVVNVALKTLSADFNTDLATIQWVATGYTLALATVIPLTGWAADRFGTKRLYLASIGMFVAGSALSGLAWSSETLIFFRVLQGLGGGMLMPAGMTILTRAAGPQRVGRVMGVIGVPMLIGPILGPILGGWLVDDVSWRWIFYVNVPIGAVALVLASRILPADRPQPSERLDVLGLALLSPGLAAFVYGLAETSSQGGLSSPKAVIPLFAGVILITAFILHARRTQNALIDVRLFSHGTVSAASATTCLFAMSFFGAMLLLPLYYQIVRGASALEAGLLLAPQGFGAMLTMPIAGRMTDRTGAGRIVLVGLAFVLVGTVAFALVTDSTSYWLLGGALFVRGIGMGATMMPAMSAAYQTLSHAAVARATSALNIIQRVGGSIGTAVLAIVLQHQITSEFPVTGRGGGGLEAVQSLPPRLHDQVAPKLANAFGSTFWWAVAMTALAVIPALLLPRHPPAPPELDRSDEEVEEAEVAEQAAVLGA